MFLESPAEERAAIAQLGGGKKANTKKQLKDFSYPFLSAVCTFSLLLLLKLLFCYDWMLYKSVCLCEHPLTAAPNISWSLVGLFVTVLTS